MSEKFQLKGSIYDIKFVYNSKLGGIYDINVAYERVI